MTHPISITKAIIPIAGAGTRFLPITKSVPKALLPIFDKPLIHYVVKEAAEAGLKEIAIVHSPNMENVLAYFKPDQVLTDFLVQKGKNKQANELNQISELANITGICQPQPLGLGHAILTARDWINEEPFAVLLPDDLLWHGKSAIRQLLDAYAKYGGQVLASVAVSPENIPFKGIIDVARAVDSELNLVEVNRVVEKPPIEEATSNLAIFGRYILHPSIFNELERAKPGAIGEIQITDAIQAVSEKVPLFAVKIRGEFTDTGNPEGMFEAILQFARTHSHLKNIAVETVKRWSA